MKPSILITSALALILLVIAAFLFARAFSGVAAPGAMGGQPNQAAAAAAVRHGILPGILYVLGLLLAFVSWVLGLIQSIRLKRWIWLVFFILFSASSMSRMRCGIFLDSAAGSAFLHTINDIGVHERFPARESDMSDAEVSKFING